MRPSRPRLNRALVLLGALCVLGVLVACEPGDPEGSPSPPAIPATGPTDDAAPSAPATSDGASASVTPEGSSQAYRQVQDDSGALVVEIPEAWTELDTATPYYLADEPVGVQITASPDIEAWYTSFSVPGVFVAASASLAATYDAERLLARYDLRSACEYLGRDPFTLRGYVGVLDSYSRCNGSDAEFRVLSVAPADGGYLVLIQFQIVSDADFDAYDRVLRTFEVRDPTALP